MATTNTSQGCENTVREDDRALLLRAENELEVLLLAGLDSGPAQVMTREDWARVRGEVRKKLAELRRRVGS